MPVWKKKSPKKMKKRVHKKTLQREGRSPKHAHTFHFFRSFAIMVWLFSILVGIAIGWSFTSVEGLAQRVRQLENLRPSMASQVFDMHGNLIHEFAIQKRIPVQKFEDIPAKLVQAIRVTEDEHFFRHPGIDPVAILRAAYRNFRARRIKQGASTITMQVARMVFLSPKRTFQRKIKEAFLALQIEKHFTKEEIFLQYYNNVYLGHGTYGFEAAARYYFGKPTRELSWSEVAYLAGLIQRPAAYSAYRSPDRAIKRRNHVLRRLRDTGVIDDATYTKALREPLKVISHEKRSILAPYFIEEVRKYIDNNQNIKKYYGNDALYHSGLRIYTTLDVGAQKIAEEALLEGLEAWARRRKWHGVIRHVDHENLESVTLPEWPREIEVNDRIPVLLTEVSKTKAIYRIGSFHGMWTLEDLKWLKTNNLRKRMKEGDVVWAHILSIDPERRIITAELINPPGANGAFVALDPMTGAIRVMVGGKDFQQSKFNRVTQAKRQPGSAFKPIVWLTALLHGYTPATLVEDAPIQLKDPVMDTEWKPGNFDDRFMGPLTLQRALELSRNTVSVRLALGVGINNIIETSRKLGLDRVQIPPYPSIALGTIEVTLLDMTSVYAVFANGGIRIRPYFIERIEDRYGRIIEQRETHLQLEEVIPPEYAYIMTTLLQGVIKRGTAYAAHDLPFDAAGKTGTTNNFTDAWFIGYTPLIVAGTWIGYDEPRRLGYNETGGHTALPVWKMFMEKYMEGKARTYFEPPENVVLVPVDPMTGLRAGPDCTRVILMAFIPGTEPFEYCNTLKHEELLRQKEQMKALIVEKEDNVFLEE